MSHIHLERIEEDECGVKWDKEREGGVGTLA